MARVLAPVIVVLLLCPVSRGQEKTFEIRGSVINAADDPVPGVQLTLLDDERGSQLATVTDNTGAFSFLHLSSGRFSLNAVRNWFFSASIQNLKVGDGSSPLVIRIPLVFEAACVQPISSTHYLRLLDRADEKDLVALSGTVTNRSGDLIPRAVVTLYSSTRGRIASGNSNSTGSFSFPGLAIDGNYWIQVLHEGYFVGEFTNLDVFAGYESIYDDLQLEPCEPGRCDPSLREIRVIPPCE